MLHNPGVVLQLIFPHAASSGGFLLVLAWLRRCLAVRVSVPLSVSLAAAVSVLLPVGLAAAVAAAVAIAAGPSFALAKASAPAGPACKVTRLAVRSTGPAGPTLDGAAFSARGDGSREGAEVIVGASQKVLKHPFHVAGLHLRKSLLQVLNVQLFDLQADFQCVQQ